eukprot:2803385-Rhodomonas_salina.1
MTPIASHLSLHEQITLEICCSENANSPATRQTKLRDRDEKLYNEVMKLTNAVKQQHEQVLRKFGASEKEKEITQHLHSVQRLAQSKTVTLLVAGQTGHGKTSLINALLVGGMQGFQQDVDKCHAYLKDFGFKSELTSSMDMSSEATEFLRSQLWSEDHSDMQRARTEFGKRMVWTAGRGLLDSFGNENTAAEALLQFDEHQEMAVVRKRRGKEPEEIRCKNLQQVKGLMLKTSRRSGGFSENRGKELYIANLKYAPRIGRPVHILDTPGVTGQAGISISEDSWAYDHVKDIPFMLVLVVSLSGDCAVDQKLAEALTKLGKNEFAPPIPPLIVFTKWDEVQAKRKNGDSEVEEATGKKLLTLKQALDKTLASTESGESRVRGGPLLAALSSKAIVDFGDSEDSTSSRADVARLWLKVNEVAAMTSDRASIYAAARHLRHVMDESLQSGGIFAKLEASQSYHQNARFKMIEDVAKQAKNRLKSQLEKILEREIYRSTTNWPTTLREAEDKWESKLTGSPLRGLAENWSVIESRYRGGTFKNYNNYVKDILNGLLESWNRDFQKIVQDQVSQNFSWFESKVKEGAKDLDLQNSRICADSTGSDAVAMNDVAAVMGGGALASGGAVAGFVVGQAAETAAAATSWYSLIGWNGARAAATGGLTTTGGALMGFGAGGVAFGAVFFTARYLAWSYESAQEDILNKMRTCINDNIDKLVSKIIKDFDKTVDDAVLCLKTRVRSEALGNEKEEFISVFDKVCKLESDMKSSEFRNGYSWLCAPEELREIGLRYADIPKELWSAQL